MDILLIKPKHIGDTLILTPTITGIKQAHPQARIWVVVRRGCEGVLAGCPDIHRILTVAAVDKTERRRGDFFRDLGSLVQLLGVRFDYVFELGDGHRGRLFARLCRTSRRYSVKPLGVWAAKNKRAFLGVSSFEWASSHRVEKDYCSVAEFLPLPQTLPPLRFDREFTQGWEPGDGLTDFCMMQIGKRQSRGRWYRERWEELGRELLERFETLVIVTGPVKNEIEDALWLREQLGPRAVCTLGDTNWAQVAGLLYRARLYVGLDTAATHLAAACGCPIVVMFGPTEECHWLPWRSTHRIVTSTPSSAHDDPEARYQQVIHRTMDQIQVREVVAACDELIAERRELV